MRALTNFQTDSPICRSVRAALAPLLARFTDEQPRPDDIVRLRPHPHRRNEIPASPHFADDTGHPPSNIAAQCTRTGRKLRILT